MITAILFLLSLLILTIYLSHVRTRSPQPNYLHRVSSSSDNDGEVNDSLDEALMDEFSENSDMYDDGFDEVEDEPRDLVAASASQASFRAEPVSRGRSLRRD